MNEIRWTDYHCHLPDDRNAAALVVQEAKELGVERLIDVGTSVEQSVACCSRAAEFDGVWATAGVHPHAAKDGIDGFGVPFLRSKNGMYFISALIFVLFIAS